MNLGYKIPIPSKADVKKWDALRDQHWAAERQAAEARRRTKLSQRHELEKELERIQARPVNPDRSRLVKLLQKKLRAMNA